MIVTISGQAGSGKSTVARLLARRLGFKHYSMGDLRRKMAEEKGISLSELNSLGERDGSTDRGPDDYQKELGRKEDKFVIDGRLSFHFIPHSVKVYLDARLDVRAKRVFKDERGSEKFQDLDEAKLGLVEREKSDSMRYLKYYGIDCFDRRHYDLVIDTSDIPAKGVAERIVGFLENRGSG